MSTTITNFEQLVASVRLTAYLWSPAPDTPSTPSVVYAAKCRKNLPAPIGQKLKKPPGLALPTIEEDAEKALWAELNKTRPQKRPLPADYVCHTCYQKGHWIHDCPKVAAQEGSTLTPYQGSNQCYGKFECGNCKRKWESDKSYANKPEQCKKCKIDVYPKKQLPISQSPLQSDSGYSASPCSVGSSSVCTLSAIDLPATWSTEYE